jgi:hypothetical protein
VKKTFLIVAALVSFTTFAFAEDFIAIDVAPNVLNLQSGGECVTVHTDIAYADEVDCSSVTLKSETASIMAGSCFSDDRGYFVAKFSMIEVRDDLYLTTGEYNTLKLTGVYSDREEFSGTQEIWVVDNDDPINGPNNGPKGPR